MRILLPVPHDGTPPGTIGLCASVASSLGASVRVLYVVDREGIGRLEAGAHPGSIRLAEETVSTLERREEGEGEREVEESVHRLVELGVTTEGVVAEGDPHELIVREAAGCDLLVSSIGSRYAYRGGDRPGSLVLRAMKEEVVPVLLAGRASLPVRTVAAGCDGGEHSIRALSALARIGLWKGERILLASSHREPEESVRRTAEAREILIEAGYDNVETRILQPPKTESFPAFCREEGAGAAILGGWGEHRWDDLLGFSLTGTMLRDGALHLFLYM